MCAKRVRRSTALMAARSRRRGYFPLPRTAADICVRTVRKGPAIRFQVIAADGPGQDHPLRPSTVHRRATGKAVGAQGTISCADNADDADGLAPPSSGALVIRRRQCRPWTALLSLPMAASIFRRWPSATPISLRSWSVRWRSTDTSILFSAKHSAYSDMPKFSSHSATCCVAALRGAATSDFNISFQLRRFAGSRFRGFATTCSGKLFHRNIVACQSSTGHGLLSAPRTVNRLGAKLGYLVGGCRGGVGGRERTGRSGCMEKPQRNRPTPRK